MASRPYESLSTAGANSARQTQSRRQPAQNIMPNIIIIQKQVNFAYRYFKIKSLVGKNDIMLGPDLEGLTNLE